MSSCSSSKKIISKRAQLFTKADKIVSHAKKYTGTKYQFGGVTKKGMDCSGLIFVAYKKENILLSIMEILILKYAQRDIMVQQK